MKVRFKKLDSSAKLPSYAHKGDAGLDLEVRNVLNISPTVVEYGFGLAVEIPKGYVGLLFPRSSVYKTGMVQTNCVGVIDSGYRGEIKVKFYKGENDETFEVGDRACQLIILPYPNIEAVEVEKLSETPRGEGGFGSTGK